MRVAILDDYQQVSLSMADWQPVRGRATIDVFTDHLTDPPSLVERLAPYDILVLMRERTLLPAAVIDALPQLKLIVSTGRRNPGIDLDTARARGVVVCGTDSPATAPVELTWALILGLARHLVTEAENVRDGGWQTAVGRDLAGAKLGIVGLGRLGAPVAAVGRAFGMEVLGWSRSLSKERAATHGVEAVGLHELLGRSDVVTIHLPLTEETRGLIGARELALMKPGALLVNTSRGPIIDEAALLAALADGSLGGVGLDVFDEEPLPVDHPLRTAPRTLLTPHVGYVTEGTYRVFYGEVVENIVAFLDGAPIRALG
ncbi:MAG TPA: D-2-hydroxyacid dehydrogenase family protein [Nocardioidaceae bacterium]|nr:D-2-hydroxyacid dehydrogenase family protein [Nocardioidaceae bacterium]